MTAIITATGKVFNTDYFTEHRPSQTVYFRILGETEETITGVFGNEEETKRLVYNGKAYEGFTVLQKIKDEGGAMKVRLGHG